MNIVIVWKRQLLFNVPSSFNHNNCAHAVSNEKGRKPETFPTTGAGRNPPSVLPHSPLLHSPSRRAKFTVLASGWNWGATCPWPRPTFSAYFRGSGPGMRSRRAGRAASRQQLRHAVPRLPPRLIAIYVSRPGY